MMEHMRRKLSITFSYRPAMDEEQTREGRSYQKAQTVGKRLGIA